MIPYEMYDWKHSKPIARSETNCVRYYLHGVKRVTWLGQKSAIVRLDLILTPSPPAVSNEMKLCWMIG